MAVFLSPLCETMCGIAGIVNTSFTTTELEDRGKRMMHRMMHRGPDYQGSWQRGPVFFGHNRLSIIDLSNASNQPMEYGRYTLTYNGEIYNYLELRSELQAAGVVFNTTGDVEVILAAYTTWGKSCVEKFIGMWAFAIWDSQEQELFCSRDRFGIKPFHYVNVSHGLAFASEIKALRSLPECSTTINEQQIIRGLYLGWMHHGTETYFADVVSLPAAHNLVWKNGAVHTYRYAELNTDNVHHCSFDESVEVFRELFLDSIKLTSRRDVPMGVCLSGGLDSTSIASALARSGNESTIKTFTAYYTGTGDVDERPYINHVLDAYPSIEAHYISPTDADVAEALDTIVAMMDAPMPSSSYISQYFVMKLAASHGVKVVLDGQGSDEILGGYMHSMYRVIADIARSGNVVGALHEWRSHGKRQHFSTSKNLSVLAKSILVAARNEPQLYALELERTYPWVMHKSAHEISLDLADTSGSKLNGFLYNLIHTTLLPTLLHTEDINSMALSIESRVPFLDHRLVEACFAMPNEHKVHRGETKRVLRKAMRGLVPDAVLDRPDKTGFITPGHIKWLRGELRYVLEGGFSELNEFVDTNSLSPIIDQYNRGDNTNALFIWRLAMLRMFLRNHA